jgi:hypothetical protein
VPGFIADAALAEEQEPQPRIGEMAVQTIPEKHYLHGGFETDFKSMGAPVVKTLTELISAARENKVGLHGPVIHYYHGAPHRDPEKQFKMETGFFVPKETAAVGAYSRANCRLSSVPRSCTLAQRIGSETPGNNSTYR